MSDEKRLVVVYRSSLDMSRGKIAAQAVHAALAYSQNFRPIDTHQKVVVLGLNEGPFARLLSRDDGVAIKDRGDTEVPRGTVTCLAFEDTQENRFDSWI